MENTDIKMVPWNNNYKQINCVLPIVGVPFVYSTRVTKTI